MGLEEVEREIHIARVFMPDGVVIDTAITVTVSITRPSLKAYIYVGGCP
jgi:hypothetical protein